MRTATTAILLAVVAGLIGWDVAAILRAGPQASISDVVLTASLAHPAIPFGVGFLAGHLFWPQRS